MPPIDASEWVRYSPVVGVVAIFYRLWSAVGCFPLWYSPRPCPSYLSSSKSLSFFYACWYVRLHPIWEILSLGPAHDTSLSLSSSLPLKLLFPEPAWETKVLPCLTFKVHIWHNLVSGSIVRAYLSFLQPIQVPILCSVQFKTRSFACIRLVPINVC